MQFHHKPPFNRGLTILSPRSGASADMLMDFGILVLADGETYEDHSATDERVWLLARGQTKISWDGGNGKVSRTQSGQPYTPHFAIFNGNCSKT